MANANGWGDGASNNNIGWGKGANNAIGWGDIHADSWAGLTDIVGTPALDPDAQAYFTANSTYITSTADKNAINTFFVGVKTDGVYSKIKAMYLPIWGAAAGAKWNLKDPRDLDAAFRLNFTNGWTFSSSGMTPSNAYANSFLNPSPTLTLNSTHISYYSRTNVSEGVYDMGTVTLSDDYLTLNARNPANNFRVLVNDGAIGDFSNTDSRGLFLANRTAASVRNSFVNGVKKLNDTTTATRRSTNSVYLGALNNAGSAAAYSTKQCAFASIGDGLTDTEAANFYSRVQTLMTYFGIQV